MLGIALASALSVILVADKPPAWRRSVAPSGWTEVESDANAVVFIRDANRLQTKSHPAAWLRVEYRRAQAPFGFVSSSVLAHIDCESATYTLSEFSFFPGRNLSGRPKSIPDADKAAEIMPGSRLQALYAAVCPAKSLDPERTADSTPSG